MQDENIYSQKLNLFARRTLQSGVKPIETLVTPLFDADFGEAIAYRLQLRVNSVFSGVYGAEDYLSPRIGERISVKYALRSLRKALGAYAEFVKRAIPCSVLFVRCPVSLLYAKNAGELLSAELAACAASDESLRGIADKICLEFDGSAMDADGKTLESVFSEVRALRIKTAVDGLGGEDFALEKLICACPDFVFTSARLNALTTDPQKNGALAPVVNLVANLGGRVVADEIETDEQLREYRSREIFGFVPSALYTGRLDVTSGARPLQEVIDGARTEENERGAE